MVDHNNPTVVTIPHTFATPADYPTEVMAERFQAWRVVIKDIVSYLKEYASVQEEIVRQQMRLQHAVGTANSPHHKEEVDLSRFFLPAGNGSVQDIGSILTKYHTQNVTNASKTLKEINNVIVPKLEELRKDLVVKIKEIKNLHNDFKTNLGKELVETKALLAQHHQAIETSTKLEGRHNHNDPEHAKNDPYLVKIKLERQLRRQLNEEQYLYDAYANLQNAGEKLESIIVYEIQSYVNQFLALLDAENQTFGTILLGSLNEGFLSKEPTFEWDSFIARNVPSAQVSVSAVGHNSSSVKSGCFIDLQFPARKAADLAIPDYGSTLNIAVREGFLERRSKYLKSYSSGWYVLTCNYLHEFKTADRKRDQTPAMSLSLDACTVSEHSKDDGKPGGVYKFILASKSTSGLMNRTHNWVFRTDTYKSMIEWYNDIKSLTSLSTPSARARYLNKVRPETLSSGDVLSAQSSHLSRMSSRVTPRSSKDYTRVRRERKEKKKKELKEESPKDTSSLKDRSSKEVSTFSQKPSPRLSNMINSDGTIITPVETNQEKKDTKDNKESKDKDTKDPKDPKDGHIDPSQYGGYVPSVPVGSFVATPRNFQYYIPPQGGQQPQFYDPVQQQYFTLTPSVPASSIQGFQPQPQAQNPQPQYFSTSPKPDHIDYGASFQSGSSYQPGSPTYVNNGGYFPSYPVEVVYPKREVRDEDEVSTLETN